MTQTQAEPKIFTFDEFIEWYPENSERRYELHHGVIVEMPKPRGKHSKLTGYLIEKLLITIRETGKGDIWFIPRESIVKPIRNQSGYEPDIIVLNQETISNETRWESESVIQNAASVKLIVEVVSTNWRDDYYDKFRDYEEMGIPEYWIVDYAGLGGRDFIGNPKQPAFFVCELIDGEYVKKLFRGNDVIVSPTFPKLNLTAQQVFD
ncbi:MAG: Uma2 family endonuclease [Nostoc sp. DedVER02]|uniref:Uma2 family endonuclease n=1 Tax=unclassified Nostoc TaxID=2593658 RepID=UPI002AD3DE1D|nr:MULTISPECIES: Uma2 family endonuclease [unclassified Nostoc]MDZ7985032.1 Uma2 family endonuclease [Nostoc sp. DedVER02]MDZ8114080.1 Uma2 family endonuclease [Nostoc sp. DedVER01b]